MRNRNGISKLYKRFSEAEGNQHIASEFAILKLRELIRKFETRNVLEVGLGIGSIAGTLLELHEELNYSGTESNLFCLQSLPRNLGRNYKRLTIYRDLRSIPGEQKFDLIIIDGKDPDLPILEKKLSKRGIFVLEGDRLPQQEILEHLFPRHKMVHSISLSKNKSYSPFPAAEWQGGLKIFFVEPSDRQWGWWFKERIFTKLKYQYPGRHMGKTSSVSE